MLLTGEIFLVGFLLTLASFAWYMDSRSKPKVLVRTPPHCASYFHPANGEWIMAHTPLTFAVPASWRAHLNLPIILSFKCHEQVHSIATDLQSLVRTYSSYFYATIHRHGFIVASIQSQFYQDLDTKFAAPDVLHILQYIIRGISVSTEFQQTKQEIIRFFGVSQLVIEGDFVPQRYEDWMVTQAELAHTRSSRYFKWDPQFRGKRSAMLIRSINEILEELKLPCKEQEEEDKQSCYRLEAKHKPLEDLIRNGPRVPMILGEQDCDVMAFYLSSDGNTVHCLPRTLRAFRTKSMPMRGGLAVNYLYAMQQYGISVTLGSSSPASKHSINDAIAAAKWLELEALTWLTEGDRSDQRAAFLRLYALLQSGRLQFPVPPCSASKQIQMPPSWRGPPLYYYTSP